MFSHLPLGFGRGGVVPEPLTFVPVSCTTRAEAVFVFLSLYAVARLESTLTSSFSRAFFYVEWTILSVAHAGMRAPSESSERHRHFLRRCARPASPSPSFSASGRYWTAAGARGRSSGTHSQCLSLSDISPARPICRTAGRSRTGHCKFTPLPADIQYILIFSPQEASGFNFGKLSGR